MFFSHNCEATGLMSMLYTVHFLFFAARIENMPTPPNMLMTVSPSLITSAILSRSVDNLGEKNAFSTSTKNLHPNSLYSVSVLSSPASNSNDLVLKSPVTSED